MEFYITLVRIQPKPNGLGYFSTYSQLKSLGTVKSIAQESSLKQPLQSEVVLKVKKILLQSQWSRQLGIKSIM